MQCVVLTSVQVGVDLLHGVFLPYHFVRGGEMLDKGSGNVEQSATKQLFILLIARGHGTPSVGSRLETKNASHWPLA